MTDRMFTNCCYGTEHQHRADERCPRKGAELDDLDRVNWRAVWEAAERKQEQLIALRNWLESIVITGEHPESDPLYALRSVAETAEWWLTQLPDPLPTNSRSPEETLK